MLVWANEKTKESLVLEFIHSQDFSYSCRIIWIVVPCNTNNMTHQLLLVNLHLHLLWWTPLMKCAAIFSVPKQKQIFANLSSNCSRSLVENEFQNFSRESIFLEVSWIFWYSTHTHMWTQENFLWIHFICAEFFLQAQDSGSMFQHVGICLQKQLF